MKWNFSTFSKQHPTSKQGYTKPISNDRGHLLPGVARSNESPWGTFKGTWDMKMDCRNTVHCQTLTTLKSEGASCLKPGAKSLVQPGRTNEIMKFKLRKTPVDYGKDDIVDVGTPAGSRQGTPAEENDLLRPESVHPDQDRKATPETTPIPDIGTPLGIKPTSPIKKPDLA